MDPDNIYDFDGIGIYQFTIILDIDPSKLDYVEEKAYEICNDALLSCCGGIVRLDFDRESDTRAEAIDSAVKSLQNAGFKIKSIF